MKVLTNKIYILSSLLSISVMTSYFYKAATNMLLMKDMETISSLRVTRFYNHCEQWRPGVFSMKNSRILHGLVSDKFKTIVYINQKAGSNTWSYALAHNTQPHKPITEHTPLHSMQVMAAYDIYNTSFYKPSLIDKYYSVWAVRHPLTRIESVYNDKMSQKQTHWCQVLGKYIKHHFANISDVQMNSDKYCIEFADFLEFLIARQEKYLYTNNLHWKPFITNIEDSCSTKFDYIGKSETQTADVNYIIDTRLSGRGKNIQRNIRRKQTAILTLFSTLKQPEYYINRLMKHYKTNMEFHGYGYKVVNSTVYANCKTYFKDKCV